MPAKLIDLRFEQWEREYRLPVLIFPSLEEMFAHGTRVGVENSEKTRGLFVGLNHRVGVEDDDPAIISRSIGHICLVEGEFGAGIFAHELQHFLSNWADSACWDVTGDNFEDIAYLAGDLTNDFWTKYYEWKGAPA